MLRQRKERVNENVQVNFNQSSEIAYWAKKYNVSPAIFQKTFEETGGSITKTLTLCMQGRKRYV
jgi:hypothetical protein